MDIFSVGCVMVELLSNGQQIAFTLSQAIDYKKMDDHSAKRCLAGIVSNLPEEYRDLLVCIPLQWLCSQTHNSHFGW